MIYKRALTALILSTTLCAPVFAQGTDQTPTVTSDQASTNQSPDNQAVTGRDLEDLETVLGGDDPLKLKDDPTADDGRDPNDPPPEVRAEVDERVAQLQRDYDALKEQHEDLERLREEDKSAFEKRMGELEDQFIASETQRLNDSAKAMEDRIGMAGRLNSEVTNTVNGTNSASPAGSTGSLPSGTTGPTGAPSSGFPSPTGAPSSGLPTSFPAPTTGPTGGLPSTPPTTKPTWWQKLLTKAAEGAGRGLGKLLKKQLAKIRNKADKFIKEEADKHPKYKTWIAKAIRIAADNILSGKYGGVGSGGGSGSTIGGGGSTPPGSTPPFNPGGPSLPSPNPPTTSLPPAPGGSGQVPPSNGGPVIINNGGTVIINNGPTNMPAIPPSPRAPRQRNPGGSISIAIDIPLGR